MANDKKAAGKSKLKMPAVPKGWKEASSSLAGWFARVPGNVVVGVYRGMFKVKGKFGDRNVFRIEVVEGDPRIGDEENGEVAEVGSIIGLDETGYTKKIGDYEPGQALRVVYVGKDGDGKQDPHIFQVQTPE